MSKPLTRDIIVSARGIPFVVTVWMVSALRPNQEPRRMCIRVAGSKTDIDEALDAGVLAEIDRRIKGGIEQLPDADADTKFPPDALPPERHGLTVELSPFGPQVKLTGGRA